MGAAHAAIAANQLQACGPNVHWAPVEGDSDKIRMTRLQLNQIVGQFHQYRMIKNGGQPRVETSERMVETFLYFLSGGGYLWAFARPQGIAISMVHLHIQEVADFLLHVAPEHITLPLPNELPFLSMGTVVGRHIVLLIDGKLF